jgi:hypothetical protein
MAAANINHNQRFVLANFSGNRWLSIRLEFLGGMMAFFSALYVVLPLADFGTAISAATAGIFVFCFSYFFGNLS